MKISRIDLGPGESSRPADSFSVGQLNGPAACEEIAKQPNKEQPNCVIHGKARVYIGRVVHFSKSRFHSPFPLYPFSRSHSHIYNGAQCSQQCFSRLRKCRLETEKPKIIRGDFLDYQRTLVGLILSVLDNGGEPSPSRTDPLYDLDPEIELTLRRLRKATNVKVSNSSNSDSVSSSNNNNSATNNFDFIEYSSINIFAESR
ncbi:hypothetical protein CR513_42174, partial [Mucuna pruriens]